MGSGKSYTGRLLAERLGRPYIDLDDRIEARAEMTVSNIFRDRGEDTFRMLEAYCLRTLPPGAIVATGGGAPCFHDGMDYMIGEGLTVFLDPSEAILISRLTGEREQRPLLEGDAALRQLIGDKMLVRRPVYERAKLHLRYGDPRFDVVGELLGQIEQAR